MSAVLPITAAQAPHSEGVWRTAWRRFRNDRVGMVSLAIVAAFLVLIALSATRVVARHWQAEVGVPSARSRVTVSWTSLVLPSRSRESNVAWLSGATSS